MTPGSSAALAADRWLGALWRVLLFVALHTLLLWFVLQPLVAALPLPGEAARLGAFTAAMLLSGLLVGIVLLRFVDGRPPGALGFAWSPQVARELGAGMSAGVLPMLVIALLLALLGMLRFAPDSGSAAGWLASALAALLTFTVAAAAEEVVYRGYAFQALVRGIGAWPTLLLTSVLFAMAHGGNPSVTGAALLNIFLAGIVLGLAYLRTLSLWLATALHVGWNWSMASLLDLPVSGLTLIDTPLYEPSVGGPAWLSGRDFGPEGGLVGTLGLVLAVLVMRAWPRLAPSPEQLARRPLPVAETTDAGVA